MSALKLRHRCVSQWSKKSICASLMGMDRNAIPEKKVQHDVLNMGVEVCVVSYWTHWTLWQRAGDLW